MDNQIANQIFDEGLKLMESKNRDYAGVVDNISIGGQYGIALRLLDKIMRLMSLLDPVGEEKIPNNESIRDTFIDIMNYGNIGVQLIEGVWNSGKQVDGKDLLRFFLLSWVEEITHRGSVIHVFDEDDGEVD